MSQTEMLLEVPEMKGLKLDDKMRALYRMNAEQIESQAKQQMTLVKEAKTIEDLNVPVAWSNEKQTFIKQVEEGVLGTVRAIWHKKWFESNAEIKEYVDPAKRWKKEVMDAVTKKRQQIKLALAAAEAKKNAKLEEKAIAQREEQAQALIEAGKAKAAKVLLNKPLTFTPVSFPMPKIKGAVWKKNYTVTIEDLAELLIFIAKNKDRTFLGLIEQDVLVSRLEALAVQLDGNMAEFKGIKCFQGENPALGGSK